jgi:hypothetical protein
MGHPRNAGHDEGSLDAIGSRAQAWPNVGRRSLPSGGIGSLEFFGRQRPAAPNGLELSSSTFVHHRGQITTYLRPMGSTVPQIYGPSGDEP